MKYKIAELCEINRKNISKKDDIEYINYLDTSNLTEGVIKELKQYNLKNDKVPSRAKRLVRENDILISTVRPNQKHYGILREIPENLVVSTGFAVLTPDQKKVYPEYLYRFLTQNHITEYLQSIAETSTSAYPSIKPSVIGELEIDLPPLAEQKSIADIFLSIDQKITINNKINNILEKIAMAIYKHWFIDFEFPNENGEPYKSSGGEFVLSESIKIPIGWKFRKLNEVVNIKYGKNLPTKNLLDNGFPVFGGNGKIGYFNEYLYEKPQVLVACRGAASGKVLTSLPYSFVTNNSLVLEYENGPLTFEYLKYYCLQNPFFQYVTGSAQPQITITNISNAPILIPNKTVLLKYSQIVKSIEEKILLIKKENKYLSNIRDTLLPKLMSGEIRVPVESD